MSSSYSELFLIDIVTFEPIRRRECMLLCRFPPYTQYQCQQQYHQHEKQTKCDLLSDKSILDLLVDRTSPWLCRYERLAWLPVLIGYLVALGLGGKHLTNPPPAEPASAQAILSFAATIAGFVITYCSLGSDFTIYYTPSVPRYVQSLSTLMTEVLNVA